MICAIDHQWDLSVFLRKKEILALRKHSLEGVLIKTHKPQQQGTLQLTMDPDLGAIAATVAFHDYSSSHVGAVQVTLSRTAYELLVEQDQYGIRYQGGLNGSKLQLYNRATTHPDPTKTLRWYVQNKERLPEAWNR